MSTQDTPDELAPEIKASIDRMFHNVEEVVGLDHLAGVLSGSKTTVATLR